MLYVVKRDGREVKFNADKIAHAINRAANEEGLNLRTSQVLDSVQRVISYIELSEKAKISVEEIQNLVRSFYNGYDETVYGFSIIPVVFLDNPYLL